MSTVVKRETRVHEFPRPAEMGVVPSKSQFFFNRELSLLEFHARVLEEALDERNPLLERLKFLSMSLRNNWLRVLDTAERSQVDQRIGQQLHPIVSLLDAFKAEE